MGFGLGTQCEARMRRRCKGHKADRISSRRMKRPKIRAERHRARHNPECVPAYGRYSDWEY
jgi:hypothetical protein